MKFREAILSLLIVAMVMVAMGCAGSNPIQPTDNAPVISLFSPEPARISFGQTATLRWEVLDNTAAVRIDPLPGNVPTVGSYVFSPPTFGTFHFTISARNAFGTTQRFITVVVQ